MELESWSPCLYVSSSRGSTRRQNHLYDRVPEAPNPRRGPLWVQRNARHYLQPRAWRGLAHTKRPPSWHRPAARSPHGAGGPTRGMVSQPLGWPARGRTAALSVSRWSTNILRLAWMNKQTNWS